MWFKWAAKARAGVCDLQAALKNTVVGTDEQCHSALSAGACPGFHRIKRRLQIRPPQGRSTLMGTVEMSGRLNLDDASSSMASAISCTRCAEMAPLQFALRDR
jgi:hypothetical protein